MPFGIRKPSEYTRPGRNVIQPESYHSCSICDRPLNLTEEGLTPVAPCLFPPLDLDGFELTLILGCSSCYQIQKRLGFNTVEELIAHRSRKSDKIPNAVKIKRPLGRPPKAKASHLELGSDNDDFIVSLYNLCKDALLSKGYDLSTMTKSQPESDGSLARSASSSGLPDDDIEFGMTDEQRARMDKAVHDASERTKLIPSEAWNGLTAAEVLKLDNNGVPRGW